MSHPAFFKVSWLIPFLTIIIFAMPLAAFTQDNIPDNLPDLTGSWQGMLNMPGNEAYTELYLVKIGPGEYSGIIYLSWRRKGDNTPFKDPRLRNINKLFIGKFDGQEIVFDELDSVMTLPKNGFGLFSGCRLNFYNNNGNFELKGPYNDNDGKNGVHYTCKRISELLSPEYALHEISHSTITIENFAYFNPEKSTTSASGEISFDEAGYASFNVHNTVPVLFQNLQIRFSTRERDNGLRGNYDVPNKITLGKNENRQLAINIVTGLTVPPDSLHIVVKVSFKNIVISTAYLTLPVKPFFRTSEVTVPDYSSPRLKIISGYFGYGNKSYTPVVKPLDSLSASGDQTAGMWKAIFSYMGNGGYEVDENQAWKLAKSCFPIVVNKARNGDAEAMYLTYYGFQLGFAGNIARDDAGQLLEKAADAGFKPALYDYAIYCFIKKNYRTSYEYLMKSYDMGVRKAAVKLGILYEKGLLVEQSSEKAVEWFNKGMAFGDPEAMLSMADLYAAGFEDTPPDINKAMSLATLSSAKNFTGAMIFLGKVYFDGKHGIARNMPLAIKWFNAGAKIGDRQAMLALGEAYLAHEPGMVKDEQSGIFWIKKAAEAGSPKAMLILAKYYNEGTLGEKNTISARYWYNQAALNGYSKADATGINAGAECFLNFWKYADFSPSYIYVNEYGEKVADGDDGLFNGLFTGLFGAMSSYYGNQQQLIDGLDYICKKDGYKIYGGTVSSSFVSNLFLKEGETVSIKSYGIISTGMMSGPANADGLGNAWAEYRVVPDIPCSAVMAGVKDSKWQFIGQSSSYTAPKDGPLLFALNGRDYKNYKGYFDLVVQVPEN
jgi:TPR repeat protein